MFCAKCGKFFLSLKKEYNEFLDYVEDEDLDPEYYEEQDASIFGKPLCYSCMIDEVEEDAYSELEEGYSDEPDEGPDPSKDYWLDD